MKYYIDGISDEQWEKNVAAYRREFDRLAHRLPPDVLNVLENGLHDSDVLSISVYNRAASEGRAKIVQVKISNDRYYGNFVHEDVLELTFTYKIRGCSWYGYSCEYAYGEILLEGDVWVHNFTCQDSMEVIIKCKSIGWEDISR